MMKNITVGLTFAVLLVLFVTSCAFAAPPTQEGEESPPGIFVWSIQHHTPGDAALRSVIAVDESHIWAVGNGGAMIFCDGTSWTAQASDTSYALFGVTALGAGHGGTVGHRGRILFSDGTSWTEQDSGITGDVDSTSQSGFSRDYNNLYPVAPGQIGVWQNQPQPSLANWRSATSGDFNSMN